MWAEDPNLRLPTCKVGITRSAYLTGLLGGSRKPSNALGTVPVAENEHPNIIVYLNLCVYTWGCGAKIYLCSLCLCLCGIIIAALIECFCARHLVHMETDAYENTYVFGCAVCACIFFLKEK